jgi:hypothetical protein
MLAHEVWISLYLVLVLYCLWLVRWGGDEWLEGKLVSGFLATWFAPKWTADGIRIFGWAALLAGTFCFVVGVLWTFCGR